MDGTVINHRDAMRRIAVEYIEMADLKLTAGQARRLLNLPADICDHALDALVERGFLVQTRSGAFLRRAQGAAVPFSQAS